MALSKDDILNAIAEMSVMEVVALALLMATMIAPVGKLARSLNDVPGRLVRVVAAVRDQKQAAA